MTDQPLLTVNDLHTVFDTPRGALRAVDGVSLSLRAGETLGVVGESGSGKSVLGRSIMGLITNGSGVTVSGSVCFDGHDVHRLLPVQLRRLWGRRVAMVFQDPMTSLNPVKRVGLHLTETLKRHLGLGRREARDRAVELMREVGIPEPARRLRQYPHELSGGMRQRVVIAMALACGPELLIADEPTTALDVTVQKQILDLLGSLSRRRAMATILVSHDLGAIAGRSDRVAVMYGGRIVEHAATTQLFEHPCHPYTEALLASIPRLENHPHSELPTIDGNPPDMSSPPAGCRFAPRCGYAQSTCHTLAPVLQGVAPQPRVTNERVVACHFPLSPPEHNESPGDGPDHQSARIGGIFEGADS